MTSPSLEWHQHHGQGVLWPGWCIYYNPRFTYAINIFPWSTPDTYEDVKNFSLMKLPLSWDLFKSHIFSRDISLHLWFITCTSLSVLVLFLCLVLVWGFFWHAEAGRGRKKNIYYTKFGDLSFTFESYIAETIFGGVYFLCQKKCQIQVCLYFFHTLAAVCSLVGNIFKEG